MTDATSRTAGYVRRKALAVSLVGLVVTALLTCAGFWFAVTGTHELAAFLGPLVLASAALSVFAFGVACVMSLAGVALPATASRGERAGATRGAAWSQGR